jgi:hypothetical protein
MTATYSQVGRNCLADFIGFDPAAAASMAELLASAGAFASACEDDGLHEGGGYGGGEKVYWTISEFLPHVAVMIRKGGWLSKGKAWEQGNVEMATANLAWKNMMDTNSNDPETRARAEKIEDQDIAVYVKATEFLNAHFDMEDLVIASLTDYEHNLRVAYLSGVVEGKTAGILASAINFASRQQEKKAEKVDFSNSQFVGEIGKRAIFTGLRCVFPGFGGRPVVFVDPAGNKVSAWNPGFVVEKDGVYNVKATPVKQDDYKGTKSTMLNRMVLATEKDLAPKAPRKPRSKKVAAVEVVNA